VERDHLGDRRTEGVERDHLGVTLLLAETADYLLAETADYLAAEGPNGASLPLGFRDVLAYTATAGTVLNNATTTTGWTAGASTVTIDGIPRVTRTVFTNGAAGLYVNLPADVPVAGATRVVVPVRWSGAGTIDSASLAGWFTAKAASAADFGGAVISVPFPPASELADFDIVIDVSSLPSVRSIGVKSDGGTTLGGGQGVDIWVGPVRFANETALDQALNSGSPVAVVVPPGYDEDAAQDWRSPGADETVIDTRPGRQWISRLNGVRSPREWPIPADGSDVSGELNSMLGDLSDGDHLQFPAGGVYRADRPVVISGKRQVTIDFNGSTLYTTVFRGGDNNVADNMLVVENCSDTTIRGGRLLGYRARTTTGSGLLNTGGSPATAGSTKTLSTSGAAVSSPGGSFQPFYARVRVEQLPALDRALVAAHAADFDFGNVATVTLSDSTHTANDCIVELVADDATVLASRTLTLTGTPTTYAITYGPTDLHRRHRVQVRKATSATNVITVASMTEHGYTAYSSTHDSASAVTAVGVCNRVTFEDMTVEGAATDGFDFSTATTDQVTLRRCASLKAARQGMSFNQGTNYVLDDFEIGECGRSGIDVEPYAATWTVRGLRIRHGRIWNATNYGLACNNWAQIHDMHVDDVTLNTAGVGFMVGGGWDSTVTNCTSRPGNATGNGGVALFRGIRMRVSGLTHDGAYVTFQNETVTVGAASYTTAHNSASDVAVLARPNAYVRVESGWTAHNARTLPVT
jgi:hypothetical protein